MNGGMFRTRMASALLNFFLVVNNAHLYLYFLAKPINFHDAAVSNDKLYAASKSLHDQHKVALPALKPGQSVCLQDPKTSLWDSFGTVLSIRPDQLSYNVLVADRTFIRPRRLLRHLPRSIYVLHLQIPLRFHHLLYDAPLVFTHVLVPLLFTLLLLLLPHLRYHARLYAEHSRRCQGQEAHRGVAAYLYVLNHHRLTPHRHRRGRGPLSQHPDHQKLRRNEYRSIQ